MSLSIAHLDVNPEPQDGEETIALLVTVAQPEKRGDAEGWRARARCEETGRVIGRWMGDCPLSVVQSALLWLSLHPWEVVSDEEGMDYGEILEKVERPISNDQIHVRDLLDRIATNLPGRPSEIRNSVTGARIRRRQLALSGPVAPVVEDDVDDDVDDDVGVEDEVEEARPSRRVAAQIRQAAQTERNRLLQKALMLAQAGRDIDHLASALEKRADADLAETFRMAAGPVLAHRTPAVAREPRQRPARSAQAPELSVEAEAEVARYAVGDESGVRAKLDRTAARAVRERARVEAALATNARQAARRESAGPVLPTVAPVAPVAAVAAVAPPVVAAPAVAPASPVAVAAPAATLAVAPTAAKPKPSRRKPSLSVVEPAAAG